MRMGSVGILPNDHLPWVAIFLYEAMANFGSMPRPGPIEKRAPCTLPPTDTLPQGVKRRTALQPIFFHLARLLLILHAETGQGASHPNQISVFEEPRP